MLYANLLENDFYYSLGYDGVLRILKETHEIKNNLKINIFAQMSKPQLGGICRKGALPFFFTITGRVISVTHDYNRMKFLKLPESDSFTD